MIATAASNVSSKICEANNIITKYKDREGPVLPSKVNKRCPAIILAASRTASVIGRIILLIVSINTINGISGPGVPWGTKCANICWV